MYEYTIQNPPTGVVFGGYAFGHSGGYNADGSLTVRADTQANLDLIVADIEAGTVPAIPAPPLSDTEIVLAELAEKVIELEAVNAALAEQIIVLSGV